MTTVRLSYQDIWWAILEKYRENWAKVNPKPDFNYSPEPTPEEWNHYSIIIKQFSEDISDPKSIIRQFLSDRGSDQSIICPDCGRDINSLYVDEENYIDQGLCPICSCSRNYEHARDKCKVCRDMSCNIWENFCEERAYEDYIDTQIRLAKEAA